MDSDAHIQHKITNLNQLHFMITSDKVKMGCGLRANNWKT